MEFRKKWQCEWSSYVLELHEIQKQLTMWVSVLCFRAAWDSETNDNARDRLLFWIYSLPFIDWTIFHLQYSFSNSIYIADHILLKNLHLIFKFQAGPKIRLWSYFSLSTPPFSKTLDFLDWYPWEFFDQEALNYIIVQFQSIWLGPDFNVMCAGSF